MRYGLIQGVDHNMRIGTSISEAGHLHAISTATIMPFFYFFLFFFLSLANSPIHGNSTKNIWFFRPDGDLVEGLVTERRIVLES
jgi:hypothetical protein